MTEILFRQCRVSRGSTRMLTAALLLSASGLTLLATTAIRAQELIELPPIVIEGGSLDLTPVPVDRQGSAVSVIGREQIEASGASHVGDVLRQVPGLSVNRASGPGTLTEVRIRGAENNHVLVLIDGVEVNSTTDGFFDFSDLLVDDIERIEVVRGPQSGLWGSNALSGLINIVTASGRGETPSVSAAAEAGAFGTEAVSLGVKGGSETVWGAASFIGRRSDGFNIADDGSEADGFRGTNVHLRGGFALAPSLTLEGFVRVMDKNVEIDGFGAAPGAVPGDLAVAIDQVGAATLGTTTAAGATLKFDPFDGLWQTRLYGNFSETERTNVDPFFGNSSNDGERRKYGATTSFRLDQAEIARHTITGLIEQEQEFFAESFTGTSHDRDKLSTALDYRGEYLDQVFLGAAIRRDDSDAFGAFDTWRLAAAWQIPNTGTRLHGSYGTGVVFPSMFEQFGVIPGFFTPNPNLQPETSEGWDAGIEQSFANGMVVMDVTYFQQNLENEIFSTFFGPPVNLPGESTREGVEVSATVRPVSTLDIVASYTHLLAADSTGLAEVRRPEHAASLAANWRFADGKGRLGVGVTYNGEMQDIGFDAFTFAQRRVLLDAFTVVNLNASYEVASDVQLFGRVENAFDADYEETFGFNTAGVAAYAGMKIKLGGDAAEPEATLK